MGRILTQTYLAHFHLPVQAAVKMLMWDSHSYITHLSSLWPCWQHTYGSDQVHTDHGTSGQLAPHPLRARHPALHPKHPAKTVSQNLNTFNEVKGQKKRRRNNHKNIFKISQPHNSTICRLNSKFWPSKLNNILLKQFFPQFSFTFGHR